MTSHLQKKKKQNTFLDLLLFTVLKQSVTHVVLLRHGQKFAKSESESNILKFITRTYPTKESRPDYICIDKGCRLLKHIAAQGHWDEWSQTTRFIVDSYHYQNHRKSDIFCRKWCDPAPENGLAPNLVIPAIASDGSTYLKRAFNTQVNFILVSVIIGVLIIY